MCQDTAIFSGLLPHFVAIWRWSYYKNFETQRRRKTFSHCKKRWNLYFFLFGYTDRTVQKQTWPKCCALSFTAVFGQLPDYVWKFGFASKYRRKNWFQTAESFFPKTFGMFFSRGWFNFFFSYKCLHSFEKLVEPFPLYGLLCYNTLTKAIWITKEQHNLALVDYNAFNWKNLGNYHDIYLRSVVFLLGDIFQKFREVYASVQVGPSALFLSAQPQLGCNTCYCWCETGTIARYWPDLIFEKTIRCGITGFGGCSSFSSKQQVSWKFQFEGRVYFCCFFWRNIALCRDKVERNACWRISMVHWIQSGANSCHTLGFLL